MKKVYFFLEMELKLWYSYKQLNSPLILSREIGKEQSKNDRWSVTSASCLSLSLFSEISLQKEAFLIFSGGLDEDKGSCR
ncbi:hypothetical protein [Streptococcus cristatus]|uniref:hypothetical protein n=1 Tax=Streptococcus cristatus TaxID=45634 RepID=UPI000F671DE4|nr:hypothetical protein [Streptococcus cristatus]